MTHAESNRTFRDVLVITAITAALLLAFPLAALLGLAMQLAFVIAIPLAVLAALLVPLLVRKSEAQGEAGSIRGVALDQGVYFHARHAWARPMPRGRVRAGVDDLLRRALPGVDGVELPEAGRKVRQGEILVTLRQGERTVEVKAPFAGTVLAVNAAVAKEPSLIAKAPYGAGWLVDLAPEGGMRALDGLRDAGSARYWLSREVDRLFEIISRAQATAPALADGGELTPDFGAALDDESFRAVASELF